MNTMRCLLTVAVMAVSTLAQYNGNNYNNGGYEHNTPSPYNNKYVGPQIAILNHKQALGTDGSFNYAFNADNGIQQGESISPDGTRHGSYSYVDPNGKTVSLKYVAGKEGFKILEGDHIPRSVPLPAQHAAAYQTAAAQAAEVAYKSPSQGSYYQGSPAGSAAYRSYNVEDGQDDGSYNEAAGQRFEEHSGPHSFGNGFAFEFGGQRY